MTARIIGTPIKLTKQRIRKLKDKGETDPITAYKI